MEKLLTSSQIYDYASNGFTSGIQVINEKELSWCNSEIERFEEKTEKPIDFPHKSKPHHLFDWADYLVHHPKILDAVEDLIGQNILCYHATLWIKPAQSEAYVRWHQDGTYFFLKPPLHVTAWVALTQADEQAGCMKILPGSHLNDILPHDDDHNTLNLIPRGQGIADTIDVAHAKSMPLDPGQMSLHHTNAIHASFANERSTRRIGLGISYIPTECKNIGSMPATALLVRGNDEFNHLQVEKRLFAAETIAQYDYHQELMTIFRNRQDEGTKQPTGAL